MDRLYTRIEAAARITETTGVPISPRTLERATVAYRLVNGRAMYAAADLDRFVSVLISNTSRRVGRPGRAASAVEASAMSAA